MKRQHAIRLVAILACLVVAGGAWALVHAQSPLGGNKSPALAQQSSDGIGNYRRNPAAGTNLPVQSSSASGMAEMMRGMSASRSSPAADDPEMAKLADAEAELAGAAEELLAHYAAAGKPDDQKRLKAELRDTLAKQFDIERQRRELELARVEDRIKKVREQLKKRNEVRETIVDRRLDQLINDAEGLGWTAPAGAAPRGAGNDFYRRSLLGRPAATPAREN